MPNIILKLAKTESVAENIKVLQFESEDGGALPSYSAGAHIEFRLPNGEVRQYSLINTDISHGATIDPSAYVIGVRLENQNSSGSGLIYESKPGDTFQISGPINRFPLADKHNNTVLIAGGIGIAPIVSMASELKSQNLPFSVHYCARTRSAFVFTQELQGICGKNLHLYCDDEPDTKVDFESLISSIDPASEVYVCGPVGMIEEVKTVALKQGFTNSQIHFELFTPENK